MHLCVFYTALKIHISQSTADILVQAGSFEMEERGEIEMKVTKESAYVNMPSKLFFTVSEKCVFVSMTG